MVTKSFLKEDEIGCSVLFALVFGVLAFCLLVGRIGFGAFWLSLFLVCPASYFLCYFLIWYLFIPASDKHEKRKKEKAKAKEELYRKRRAAQNEKQRKFQEQQRNLRIAREEQELEDLANKLSANAVYDDVVSFVKRAAYGNVADNVKSVCASIYVQKHAVSVSVQKNTERRSDHDNSLVSDCLDRPIERHFTYQDYGKLDLPNVKARNAFAYAIKRSVETAAHKADARYIPSGSIDSFAASISLTVPNPDYVPPKLSENQSWY